MRVVKKPLEKSLHFIKKLKFLDYVIIVSLLLGAIILYKFLNPPEKWTEVVVLTQNIPIFRAYSLKVGDIEKNPSGKKTAEITTLEVYDTPTTPTSNKDVFLTINLLTQVNPRSGELEYKNKIIKVGLPVELNFNVGKVNGIISSLGDSRQKETTVTKILTLKLYDEWPWFAEGLKVGEGEVDENGQKIAEIIGKESHPAEMTVVTENGDTLLRTNPRKVDITLKVKVKAKKIKDEFLFRKDTRLLVGESFAFNAGNSRIRGALVEKLE